MGTVLRGGARDGADFGQEHRIPTSRLVGIGSVIFLHVVIIYALVTGLAQRAVEVMVQPIETKIIEEHKPPPPEVPLPPPPKLDAPPPPYIPTPEVQIQQPPQHNVISAVTTVKPAAPTAPFVREEGRQPVRVPPVIDAAKNCKKPPYPPASERLRETGTVVLRFLIDVDGRVLSSQVQSSSAHERLDEAARHGLSLCQFKPGMIDGQPEQAWATLRYTWELNEE